MKAPVAMIAPVAESHRDKIYCHLHIELIKIVYIIKKLYFYKKRI